ncbi:hypothetical protein QQP08_005718 [Theobroma cacao]|nr:hypothetical protein QQP08_005718 [Theobroma cacao]
MDSKSPRVEMFFFPYVGGGHQIPMIDIARMFAAHGAKSTIISTPKHALSFQTTILRDQQSVNVDIADTDMSAPPQTDTSLLQEPLKSLLLQRRPDCIVHDMFHRWAADVIDNLEVDIPRIVFNGNGCFSNCARENITKFKPHEMVGSDYEPFVIPGLPDRIELTRSQLPVLRFRQQHMRKPEDKSLGVVVNSFYELEPAYAEYFKKELGNRAWLVGPIGVKVGSVDWLSWNMEPRAAVGREKVEAAVKRLMGGGEEAVEMRTKARQIGEMANRAVEGGSSYKDAVALLKEFKARPKTDP